MIKKLLFTIFLISILLLPVWAGATTYYVSQTGGGGDGGDGSEIDAWSVTQFNDIANWSETEDAAKIDPGDTVQFIGTITGQIAPQRNGTSIARITLTKYDASTLFTTGGAYACINLWQDEYFTIDDLTFQNVTKGAFYLNTSKHNIIQNCTFKEDCADASLVDIGSGTSSEATRSYNTRILNNVFEDFHATANTYFSLYIINADGTLIEGNTFGDVSHTSVYVGASTALRTVVRDNSIRNRWHYGISLISGAQFALVEGNHFYDNGDETDSYNLREVDFCKDDYAVYLSSYYNIVRRNELWDTDAAFYLRDDQVTNSNKVYHNTVYNAVENSIYENYSEDLSHNYNKFLNNIFGTQELDPDCCGLHVFPPTSYDCDAEQPDDTSHAKEIYMALSHADSASWHDWIDYNLFTTDNHIYYYRYGTAVASVTIGNAGLETLSTNYSSDWGTHNIHGDPEFTSAGTDDFTLTFLSPAIDAAGPLTLTNGTGTASTALIVDDAYFFYDGWGITGESADTIYIAGTGPVQISSINYATNTITLALAQTWQDGVGVYHCPLGICFSGSAPDIGANEYMKNRIIIVN